MPALPSWAEVERAVSAAHDREWAYVLAATTRVARDLDLAEDCVQDAYAQALVHWPATGIPARPGGWLTTVATRRALEVQRRSGVLARKLPLLVVQEDAMGVDPADGFPDDRLRLIFTCCHPALAREAQLALTLRLVAGLTSAEVARTLLVKETAMQARITRAKNKIQQARIPYTIPAPDELPERVDAVLDVIHLVYTSGHTATDGPHLARDDLAARAIDLARMLDALLPRRADVQGLLALLLLSEARRPARTDAAGRLVLLEDQDRSRWDRTLIGEGSARLRTALDHVPVHRYAVLAAIAAVHDEAPAWEATDWEQLLGLYDLLLTRWPSPVVALNRAVAVSYTHGADAALDIVEGLASSPKLATYPYTAATRADLLRRLGRHDEAAAAYREAALLTTNTVEATFLLGRATTCETQS
jgi:RNA polymerase sigma-70 factor (ECF subfamily)